MTPLRAISPTVAGLETRIWGTNTAVSSPKARCTSLGVMRRRNIRSTEVLAETGLHHIQACSFVSPRIVRRARRRCREGGARTQSPPRCRLALSGCESWLDNVVASPGWAAGKDLDDAGAEADQYPDLPSPIIGPRRVEDQPAAPGTKGRSDLMHDKGDTEKGRHVAGAEHLGD